MKDDIYTGENVLETYARELGDKTDVQVVSPYHISEDGGQLNPHLVAVPNGLTIQDLTANHLAAATKMRPLRRKGTASLKALESLIAWANAFKGATSMLFANNSAAEPSLTCIANYHAKGAPVFGTLDNLASHNDHKAVYNFPLSKEWKMWSQQADKWRSMSEFSDFVEDNILDFMDPTPSLLDGVGAKEDWEIDFVELASKIQGKFGQVYQLVQMGRELAIHESSDLKVSRNANTGEQTVIYKNEHTDENGKPLSIPNLFLIAIPVFDRGDLFRMAVRLTFRKQGGDVVFNVKPHRPDLAFDNALQEAVDKAAVETSLPVIYGRPES